jgi:hypothetical protein
VSQKLSLGAILGPVVLELDAWFVAIGWLVISKGDLIREQNP